MPPPSSGGVAHDRDAEHPRTLRPESDGRGLVAGDSPDGRGDAPRVRRPRGVSGRSRFRQSAGGRADLARYADKLAETIDPERASTSQEVRRGDPLRYESEETTHFTVVDKTAMSCRTPTRSTTASATRSPSRARAFCSTTRWTISRRKPGAPNAYGLIQGEANAVAARKRPLSSMTPTIVLKDGKLLVRGRQPRRPDDHQHRHAGDRQHHRSWDEHPAGDRLAARPSSVDARSDSL